jgi:cobalt-zinc-cadmium efflux system protein
MKSQKRILTAFILNLIFAVFEFIGGALTGSVAIISDSVHDFGDSVSIGISYILEEKSKKEPDDKYTFGYGRYSVLGSLIMTVILIVGSIFVIIHACDRIIHPAEIDYNGMLLFAAFGMGVNFIAAVATRGDGSLNQQAVSLHMFEDVLGWGVVLLGAILMKFTDITYIDPIMSIGVAIFLLVHAFKHFKEICDIFFEKTPDGIDIAELKHHLKEIEGVLDVHHFHLRTLDGVNHIATLHIVTSSDPAAIKKAVEEELLEHGISHTTVEIETPEEECKDLTCHPNHTEHSHHHGHHH